jgi:hypothetical protein
MRRVHDTLPVFYLLDHGFFDVDVLARLQGVDRDP